MLQRVLLGPNRLWRVLPVLSGFIRFCQVLIGLFKYQVLIDSNLFYCVLTGSMVCLPGFNILYQFLSGFYQTLSASNMLYSVWSHSNRSNRSTPVLPGSTRLQRVLPGSNRFYLFPIRFYHVLTGSSWFSKVHKCFYRVLSGSNMFCQGLMRYNRFIRFYHFPPCSIRY